MGYSHPCELTNVPRMTTILATMGAICEGLTRCQRFGGARLDAAVTNEILRVVEPMPIDALLEAERMHEERRRERRHLAKLNLQQARYEDSLAERRYAGFDPDNRLIAVELERRWKNALQRVFILTTIHQYYMG